VEGAVLDDSNSSFAATDHYSLVPGSGITTLLLNDTHQRYVAQFSYLGFELRALPFDAVVYRVSCDSDSISGINGGRPSKVNLRKTLGAIRRKRFITRSLRKEFMLE
jgi:hypothetical protein